MTVAGQANDAFSPASNYAYNDLVKPATITSVSPLTGPGVGGTEVTILGTGFAGVAVVELEALDGALSPTGARSTCQWNGVADMSCNDTVVRYRSVCDDHPDCYRSAAVDAVMACTLSVSDLAACLLAVSSLAPPGVCRHPRPAITGSITSSSPCTAFLSRTLARRGSTRTRL